jgi:hypothetical protein
VPDEPVGDGRDGSRPEGGRHERSPVLSLAWDDVAEQLRHDERGEKAAHPHGEAGDRVAPLVQPGSALELVIPVAKPEILGAHAAEVHRYRQHGEVLHLPDAKPDERTQRFLRRIIDAGRL